MTDPNDPRARQAYEWACAELKLREAQMAPASADASFRRYFRLRKGPDSWIIMDAPPGQEDCRPFVRIARLLRNWDLNVPQVLAEDLARGYLLLGDLGTQTYLQSLTAENADQKFGNALKALLRLQRAAQDRPGDWSFLPAYDAGLLWRELRLFTEWYLPRHLRLALSAGEVAELEQAMAPLVRSALDQSRTLVHRDFMPRNLMLSDPDPGILDFQDAVAGPISYDVICLFKDAFLSWPLERVQGWLRQYWDGARREQLPVAGDFGEFRRQADWMGLQRHLKVLGIFARLTYRDGKANYVADTPRFVRYVMEVAPNYPELHPLAKLFERHVLRKVAL